MEYKELGIRDLYRIFSLPYMNDNLSDDLFLGDLHYAPGMDIIKYPSRFKGFLAFYCYQGNFEIELDLRKFTIREGSLFIYTPGNIVRVAEVPSQKDMMDMHFILIAISNDLMSTARFDFNKLSEESLRVMANPCIELSEQERELCRRYFDMIKEISGLGIPNTREAIASLMSSVFYLMGALWKNHLEVARRQKLPAPAAGRNNALLESFLRLVKDNYMEERNIEFYADKLGLTPKYLSRLIKKISGKSAREWIDSFLLLEAKSMLKYSDMNIKAIVYALGFPNATTFYRFFLQHVGCSPSEYRKG